MAKIIMGGRTSEFDQMIDREIQNSTQSGTVSRGSLETARKKLAQRKQRLMPPQLAFLTDPSKKKAAICTRRAGKTFVCRHLVAEAVLANSWSDRDRAQPVVQYIAQTRIKALDLFWTPFKEICRELGLDAHWDDHSLRAQFPNGVLVRAGGAEDKDEIEKYRGDAYPLVVIDEAASFGPRIEELVLSALSAALLDYNGTIAMIGTPGQSQAGLFWEIYAGYKPEWSAHRWSYMTNVHFPPEVRTVEWIEANVGPLESPKVQREYFGNWVSDASSLVYQYDAAKSAWTGVLPKGHDWRYILGMDLGWRDPTAFVVGAYAKTHPDLFIVHAESHSHMLPTQIAEKVLEIKGQYNITRIISDTGGSMARNNVEEWNRRYGLGILPAEKTKKFDYIEHMNSEFYLGRIKVKPELTKLQNEWKTLVYEESEKDVLRHDSRLKEHPGFANHLADACLYMFRESMHFRSKLPEAEPVPGTLDWLNKQQLDAKIKALRNAGRKSFKYGKLVN
jgi:hypothetical protein